MLRASCPLIKIGGVMNKTYEELLNEIEVQNLEIQDKNDIIEELRDEMSQLKLEIRLMLKTNREIKNIIIT